MGLLNIIRRMHLREKLSIREIARRTGLSRNTVTKHLAANTIEPKFATPDRPSKLDPFAEKLAGWLKTEAGKSRKQRRTLKQMHADLVKLGFTGSYGRVAAFARQWGSVLNFVYLTGSMRFQILKRRSARRTLWRTGCGPQTIPGRFGRLSRSCGWPGRSALSPPRLSGMTLGS